METNKVTDAEFIETSGKEIAMITSNHRHFLMVNKETEFSKKKQKELELDRKLNLSNQVALTGIEQLQNDIDELTSSRSYRRVTNGMLDKMFKIKSLRRKCLIHNAKEMFTKTVFCGLFPLIMSIVFCGIAAFYFFSNPFMSIIGISSTIFGIITLISTMISIANLQSNGTKISYTLLKVILKKEKIIDTEKKIPYGAKLKLEEALKSKIFKYFAITYPKVMVNETTVNFDIRMFLDPALLGITHDGRQYLICWWDVKKDIDKAKSDINWVKKFKVDNI